MDSVSEMVTLLAFTPMQENLFLPLCGRALDYRSPHSILADTMADESVRKLGYDCAKFHLSASPIINIALRAKKLDEVALKFVARLGIGKEEGRSTCCGRAYAHLRGPRLETNEGVRRDWRDDRRFGSLRLCGLRT